MKKLPVGKQVFRTLIEDNFVYVDKTKYLVELAESQIPTFLSRPRRFGKSVMVNTFKELFLGSKELFKDTFAYNNWNWDKKFPVIKMDMSICTGDTSEEVNYSIIQMLKRLGREYSINLEENKIPRFALIELIEKLKTKVVILVDEYDAPILDALYSDNYESIKKCLQNFYTVFKEQENNIEFLFLTGISKFTRVGIFSKLNNLRDISLNKKYSKIIGYTKEEILKFLPEHIEEAKKELNISNDKLWSKLKHYYNGYSWNGIDFLYNPFSILNFFLDFTFKPYWMETGSPTFIVKYAEQKHLNMQDFDNKIVNADFMTQYDINNDSPESFLTQAGYLTIKDYNEKRDTYTLNFSNYEVRYTFNKLLLKAQHKVNEGDLIGVKSKIFDALENNNTEDFLKQIKIIYSVIPSIYYSNNKNEYFYTSILLMFLIACGFDIVAEKYGNKGRMDLILKWENRVYILELKVTASAKSALKQIKDNNYSGQFGNFEKILIGLKVDLDEKNVVEWIIEEEH